jgi:hypothetical protein
VTSQGEPMARLRAPGKPATNQGVPATTLGAHRITVEQSGKTPIFGNASGAAGNHSYY